MSNDIILSSDAKALLKELIQSDNPPKLLQNRFKNITQKEEAYLRGLINELTCIEFVKITWFDNVPFKVVINNTAIDYVKSQNERNTDNNVEKDNNIKKIFISHRSTDEAIYNMLFDFLIGTGTPREAIFCTSIPGNDVKEKISEEVKSALRSSLVNIAILSNEYYNSTYCLNEAGILWFLDSAVVIPIALPEITHDKMKGFLNGDYKIRRLNDRNDIAYIYDTVSKKLSLKQESAATLTTEMQKIIDKYNDYLNKRTLKKPDNDIKHCNNDLGFNIIKFDIKGIDSSGKNKIEFEIIISNLSDKTISVLEKYLHFYKSGIEIHKEEITRYKVRRRKDDLDDFLVLEPVNQIITLQGGHSESVGVFFEAEKIDTADRVVFTCKANNHDYEFVVYEKKKSL